MTFLLFVLSAVVIEAILAFDQRRERKRQASLPVITKASTADPQTSEGLLPLLAALDKHGRGATPQAVQPERVADPSPTDSAYNRENVRPE